MRIPNVVSLAEYITQADRSDEFWGSVGESIWKFHEAGVYHADMNAYNVQIDRDADMWLLDFDKGELKAPGPWQQETLNRLHRSLEKILGLNPETHYHQGNWDQAVGRLLQRIEISVVVGIAFGQVFKLAVNQKYCSGQVMTAFSSAST